jgi:hypothetical protein
MSTRTRHKPDHEIQLMLRVLRDLQALPPAGRQRVLAYWNARAGDMPSNVGNQHGEQQLDITDVLPPLHVSGAAA